MLQNYSTVILFLNTDLEFFKKFFVQIKFSMISIYCLLKTIKTKLYFTLT